MGVRGGRKGKSHLKLDANTEQLASNLADQQAKAYMAQRKAQQMFGPPDIMAGFGQGPAPGGYHHYGGVPKVDPRNPNLDPHFIQMMTKLGMHDPPPKLDPIRKDRNWGELLRNVPEGIYRLAQRATDGMTYAGTRADLSPSHDTYRVEDATGDQDVPIRTLKLSAQELRYKDDKVGQILDEFVGKAITDEAMEMVGQAPSDIYKYDAHPIVALLKLLLEMHAMFPAIHISKKVVPTANGEDHILGFAIQWVYEPALDEDDDDED